MEALVLGTIPNDVTVIAKVLSTVDRETLKLHVETVIYMELFYKLEERQGLWYAFTILVAALKEMDVIVYFDLPFSYVL